MKWATRSAIVATLLAGIGASVIGTADESRLAPPIAKLLEYWVLKRYVADEHNPIWLSPVAETEATAKAEKDECYAGVGNPYPPVDDGSCPSGSVPKANQSYLWGLTKVDQRYLWLGTYSNGICVVSEGLGGSAQEHPGYFVCEADQAKSGTGDFRPPRVYRYSIESGELIDRTPTSGPAFALLSNTLGLRSAGNLKGVVLLAGPSRNGNAVNFFAFDAYSGALLGAKSFTEFNDIRSWLTAGDALYAGVGVSQVANPNDPGGLVLRWRGKKSTNPDQLFRFEIVGKLDTAAGNLALHNGRIYVNTWPNFSGGVPNLKQIRYPGLYEGPRLPSCGLGEEDADSWEKVWSITDYDRDPVAALMTLGGAIESHDGSLYWGTISLPIVGGLVAVQMHQAGLINLDTNGNGKLDIDEILTTILGTHRPTTLFRGFSGKKGEPIEVVYGEKYLPAYNPVAKSYDLDYTDAYLNKLSGQTPLWGASGYGNFFNAYTWSMSQHAGSLYIGTFDITQVFRVALMGALLQKAEVKDEATRKLVEEKVDAVWQELSRTPVAEGGDLLRIDDSSGRAVGESFTGLGNTTNYGFRTMIDTDDGLFIGTANAMNIHPDGGWELIRLEERGWSGGK